MVTPPKLLIFFYEKATHEGKKQLLSMNQEF